MATNPEEEARRITEEAQREIESGARSLNSATQAAAANMGTAAQDIKQAGGDVSASIAQAEAGFRSLGQSAVNFSRALSQNDDSLSKYNGAIESAGSGLSMLAVAAFGPLGVVLGLAVKAFTSLVGAELKQVDKIVDNFNKLGELGAAAQFTTAELEGMFNDAGYNTFNGQSQMLVKTITSLGGDLLKLGSTSGEGIKTFTQLASFNSDILEDQQKIRNQFANLGYSQEKLLNAQASFMKEQGALGLGRKQVDDKLVKQSLDYTKNLSMLSAITGETTESLKASRQKDLDDFAFNMSLRQLGDSEAGQKQRALVQNMSTLIGSNVDETAQKAFRDVYSNGAAISAEAQALSQRTQGAFVQWTNEFKSGKLSPEDFINKLNESGDAMLQSMGAALKASGELRNQMGIGTKTLENTAKHMVAGQIDATNAAVDEKMKQIDPYVNFSNVVKNTTDQLAKMMDRLLELIRGPVMDAFTAAMKAVKELAIGFMKSPLAKQLGLNFDDFILSMTPDEEVEKKQGIFLDALEKKQKLLDSEAKNPSVDDYGRTPQLDQLKNDVGQLKEQLAYWQKEAVTRRLPVYKTSQEAIPKTTSKPPIPAGPSTTSTQPGSMGEYKPRGRTSVPSVEPSAPQFKFGGMTGDGFSNTSSKLTGGGIFDGPMSGYRKKLPKGKDFAVVPLPSGDTIPVSFKNDMSMASMPADLTGNKPNPLSDSSQLNDMMTSIMSVFKENDEESQTFSTFGGPTSTNKTTGALESITGKLDTLLERIRLNNSLQTELLDHARG